MAHVKVKKSRQRRRGRNRQKRSLSTPAAKHAFWSGALAFGLVSVRVALFPASRSGGVRLRLLGPDGAFLERRFYCPSDGQDVGQDEIIRGYELDDGSYITVTDRELEALEPQKSHEIDLREFVDVSEIDPALLERGYYLTPLDDSTKTYRLLAEVMEQSGRAGIATFVMREREYLVAIFAKNGILCAETLRFPDEVRDPESIGLPKKKSPDPRRIAELERAIDALHHDNLRMADLADPDAEKLRSLIEHKKRAGEGLVETPAASDGDEAADSDDADLMETIRQSLRQAHGKTGSRRKAGGRAKRAS
jgi:DNA end-binding protein Ku